MATNQLADQQTQSAIYAQAASTGSYHGSGSIGPFFAVLSVITVLTVLSCLLGRACGARAEGLDSGYDCLEWFRRGWLRCRGVGGLIMHYKAKAEVTSKPQENEQAA